MKIVVRISALPILAFCSLTCCEAGFAQAQPEIPPEKHVMPKPVNLKVLPKEIEPGDLIELMRGYSKQLGVHCEYCHEENAETRKLNFADDSKPEKITARVMITMTNELNTKYLAKLPDSDQKVVCGTCHRGHARPEPFVPAEQPHSEPIQPQSQHPAP